MIFIAISLDHFVRARAKRLVDDGLAWVVKQLAEDGHDVFWRVQHAFHNVVVHPLLPLAELLNDLGKCKEANKIFLLHDNTAPEGDEQRCRER